MEVFSSVINDNFFKDYFNVQTQEDINNLIKDGELKSPELKLMIYDFFLNQNKNNEDFFIINDETLKKTIKEYFIVLFDKEINDILINKYYEKTKINTSTDAKVNYFKEYLNVKKSLPYYEQYKKILKSDKICDEIINYVNERVINNTPSSKEDENNKNNDKSSFLISPVASLRENKKLFKDLIIEYFNKMKNE